MNKKQFHRLLDRYLANNATGEEKQLLDDFFEKFQKENGQRHAMLGEKKAQLYDEMYAVVHDRLFDNRASQTLPYREKDIKRKLYTKPSYSGRVNYYFKVAASLLLLVVAGFFTYEATHLTTPSDTTEVVRTIEKGQKLTIALPDGSVVKLNARSKLTYSIPSAGSSDKSASWQKTARTVHLEGEAFFDVIQDKQRPFTIISGDVTTTVLGTSFNVNAHKNKNITVTVATGKVKVEHRESDADSQLGKNVRSLTDRRFEFAQANQQVQYNLLTGELSKQVADPHHLDWTNGILYFDHIPLSEAIVILEDWYGVTIALENEAVGDYYISSGTYKNESLRHVLESFQFMLKNKIDFEIEGKQVVIHGNGTSNTSTRG